MQVVPWIYVSIVVFATGLSVGAGRKLVTAIPPLVLWGLLFATVGATEEGLGLAPEIWGGAVVLASMALLTVEMLVGLAESHNSAGPDRSLGGTVTSDEPLNLIVP